MGARATKPTGGHASNFLSFREACPSAPRALPTSRLSRPPCRTPGFSPNFKSSITFQHPLSADRDMNLDKLKDTARKYEQKEDWRRAIDVYLKAIQEFESGKDLHPDLSIYNRVGDLQLKVNDTSAAIRSYERAADLYTEQGFLNNAVALCGKILRINPGRLQTYYKLAQIHARKNMIVDAKRNLIEFLERMNSAGQLDDAFDAVKVFADQFSANQEIRMMLIELLRAASRTDEAIEQLEKMALDLEAKGDTVGARRTRERMHAVDHDEPGAAAQRPPQPGDLIFLDTGADAGRTAAPPKGRASPAPPSKPKPSVAEDFELIEPDMGAESIAPLADLEATSREDVDELDGVTPVEGLERVDASAAEVSSVPDMELLVDPVIDSDAVRAAQVEGLEAPLDQEAIADASADAELASADLGLESVVPDLPATDATAEREETDAEAAAIEALLREHAAQVEAEARASREAMAAPTSLDAMELAEPGAPGAEGVPSIEELENLIASDPDRPEPHRALGEALLLQGDTGRAVDEFELALGGYEFEDRRGDAEALVDLLVTLQPDNIRYYQKRVEYAYRSGERERLLAAYLELGDVLVRVQAEDKAAAVYGRVLEHDPDNQRALNALGLLSGEELVEEAPASAGGDEAIEVEMSATLEGADEEELEEEVEEEKATEPVPEPPAAPRRSPWNPPAPAVSPPRPAEPPRTAPAAKTPGGPLDFVDLGALVIDEATPRDTRMKVEQEQPTGDEQKDFEDMLAQFKRGIDENIGLDDHDAHYDLGIAFKEMGLLDEAIAEFQKALRGVEGRLRTSEALGICFFEKGQFAVAEAVLRRAVDALEGGDEAKIGLIYWLGRACEAQGRLADARTSYERAMAVDIQFMDLGTRVQRMTQ